MVERWREDQVTLQERYNTEVTSDSGKNRHVFYHTQSLNDYLNTRKQLDLIINCRLSENIAVFVDVSVVLVMKGYFVMNRTLKMLMRK